MLLVYIAQTYIKPGVNFKHYSYALCFVGLVALVLLHLSFVCLNPLCWLLLSE